MNTAFIATGTASVRPRPRRHSTIFGQMTRAGLALVAWSRGAEQSYSREELAYLHERRREAERLREERFRDVALARLI